MQRQLTGPERTLLEQMFQSWRHRDHARMLLDNAQAQWQAAMSGCLRAFAMAENSLSAFGELQNMYNYWKRDNPCSCNESDDRTDCPGWRPTT